MAILRRSPIGSGRRGRVRQIGVAGPKSRSAVAPPELRDGQERCPVCRNGVTPTTSGHLRAHKDLFGYPCYNRAVAE